MSDITYKLTVATNVGLVRTNNEDNFIVSPDLGSGDWFIPRDTNNVLSLGKDGCLLVVADGMGGMNAGEVASAIAIDTIKDCFSVSNLKKAAKTPKSIETFLRKAIVKADGNIKAKVHDDPETNGMGTTIVLAWILGGFVYVSWCGDSRAYLYNGIIGLTRLTKDHSYVQQLVDEGKLDPELAFDHPNSNIITRSLGDSRSKANPDFMYKRLRTGDIVILCSDGLCGLVRDEDIADIIKDSDPDNIETIKSNLISSALDAGGHDNVTVAVFQCISAKEEKSNVTVTGFERLSKKKVTEPEVLPLEEPESVQNEPGEVKETETETETETKTETIEEKPIVEKVGKKHKLIKLICLSLVILLLVLSLCWFFKADLFAVLSSLIGKIKLYLS